MATLGRVFSFWSHGRTGKYTPVHASPFIHMLMIKSRCNGIQTMAPRLGPMKCRLDFIAPSLGAMKSGLSVRVWNGFPACMQLVGAYLACTCLRQYDDAAESKKSANSLAARATFVPEYFVHRAGCINFAWQTPKSESDETKKYGAGAPGCLQHAGVGVGTERQVRAGPDRVHTP